MASRGRGRRDRPRGTGQTPSAFDQHAFTEAVGIAAAAITQAGAASNQGGVDDIRGIQDMGAGTKRKEDSSSSNQGKKQKTSVSQGHPGQGRGHQDQGQDGTFNQAGRGCVISTNSLDTFDRIAQRGRNPKVIGHLNPNHQ